MPNLFEIRSSINPLLSFNLPNGISEVKAGSSHPHNSMENKKYIPFITIERILSFTFV